MYALCVVSQHTQDRTQSTQHTPHTTHTAHTSTHNTHNAHAHNTQHITHSTHKCTTHNTQHTQHTQHMQYTHHPHNIHITEFYIQLGVVFQIYLPISEKANKGKSFMSANLFLNRDQSSSEAMVEDAFQCFFMSQGGLYRDLDLLGTFSQGPTNLLLVQNPPLAGAAKNVKH